MNRVHASPLTERIEAAAALGTSTLLETATGRALLLRDLVREARAVASTLADARGERVMLLAEPGIDWARSLLATIFAGAVAVPVPLGAPALELAYVASDCRPALAIASMAQRAHVPVALSHAIHDAAATEAGGGPLAMPSADDAALVLYTSGTTGRPKGAILSHANLAAQTAALEKAWSMSTSDVLLHALPLHHLHGVVVAFLTALTAGASIRMLPRFDADDVLAELRRSTVFMAVPTMIQRILDRYDAAPDQTRSELSAAARGLRLATSGSAALPVRVAERWQRFAGSIPLERYGMTEIGIALSNPLAAEARIPGWVGQPLPAVEIRIADEHGCDGDGPGELWVRGPNVFQGYFESSAATRDAFRDGWFLTGDVAVRDLAGNVRLLGRASADILKTGGEKVSALEIEEALREYEAFAEVAVVGVPDPEWGDRVVAAVVVRAGHASEALTAPMRAWAKERLVSYKVPREVAVFAALPRNAMGKVQKSAIVEELMRRAAHGDRGATR